MKNWYKKPVTKAILILMALILPVSAVLSFAVLLGSSMMNKDFLNASGKKFEDTENFQELLSIASYEVLSGLSTKQQLETDGKYDPQKLVDVVEFYEDGTISGENNSGVAYTLEQIEEWGKTLDMSDSEYTNSNDIVVCQKPDKTYHYYYMDEFRELIDEGKYQIEIGEESTEELLDSLEEGRYSAEYPSGRVVFKDENGETAYVDCWTLEDSHIKDTYAPQGAKNLLEVVNNNSQLNGKLSQLFVYLEHTVSVVYDNIRQYKNGSETWTEGNTNMVWLFADMEAKKLYSNSGQFTDFAKLDSYIDSICSGSENPYVLIKPKLKDFESNIEGAKATYWRHHVESYRALEGDYIYLASVDKDYPIQDMFYENEKSYSRYAPYLDGLGVVMILSIFWFIVVLFWLTVIAGRKAEDSELHFLYFDKIKTELAAAIVIGLWGMITGILSASWGGLGGQSYYVETDGYADLYRPIYTFSITWSDAIVLGGYVFLTAVLFLIGYMSLVRRIKGKTLWKNSLLRVLLGWLEKVGSALGVFWKNRRIVFKIAVAYAGFVILHWFACSGSGGFILIMLLAEAAVLVYLIRDAIARDRIKRGITEIASGNVEYEIDTKGMNLTNQHTAENVNQIGNGLNKAVEENMKSERLKTDLITNVSHDIKTPLTSIINYVDLLKRENFEDPKIQGYLDILEAKAQRLKTLTEDVVEASKVSSGNITLEYMNVNLVEMVNQTIGEFSERMSAKNLKIVASLPENPVIIKVDGRRMWRVLENIFNNAAKYAMPGTRIYVDMRDFEDKVSFSMKNISENPLNISADELTERFIRGDVSRSTEGSGLGLSIAKSLTELQGGNFTLYLDGDLFKVTIEFPKKK